MNYEQKYNEMLDAARYWHDVSEGDIPAVLEEIFPELAESEDERIRKHLIDCVTRTIPEADAFKEISKEQILAWLEKQGEQASFYSEQNLSNEVGNYDHSKVFQSLYNKPTSWSEEDDKIWKSIIDDTVQENQLDNKQINWLIYLKQRYTWKPSKGQIKALKEACDKSWEPDGLDPLYTLYEDLKKLKGE